MKLELASFLESFLEASTVGELDDTLSLSGLVNVGESNFSELREEVFEFRPRGSARNVFDDQLVSVGVGSSTATCNDCSDAGVVILRES